MRLLLALIFSLMLASLVDAHTVRGNVRGASHPMLVQIVSASGSGGVYKRGDYQCPSSRTIPITGLTERDGSFLVPDVPAGRHLVQILSPSCKIVAGTMTNIPSATENVVLYLPANLVQQLQATPSGAAALMIVASGLSAYIETRPAVSPAR